ncbi:MAG TPA: precorrin-4 C(11)-methyltransferase [Fibrobacteraceae bacterium]|nr:precorrin-4 C(11)-methyltransferase [Fibrobacteraceae bacterium]
MIYFVGAGPGDPELLTLKAARLLRQAQVCVYAGSLVAAEILRELPADCIRHDSAELHLEQIVAILRDAHAQGKNAVRLHSGEPALYGAIAEQMRSLDAQKIPYTQVPGISSFQAAAAALQVELTVPEVAQTVVLTRSPGRTPMPGEETWAQIFRPDATYCLFLSVDQIAKLVPQIAERMGFDCPCAVVYHASRPDQQIFQGTLENIAAQVEAAGIRSTAQILIGRALSKRLPASSRLYAQDFSHGFRAAP